ncbi:MAG: competence/damage-inducible protein A [candidate division KSB1 bacterium]|nr:competence/damage-inducible protein A [candidate division KSB1 bacterium]
MDIEVLSIGDELLSGQTVNSNASWMGQRLVEIGVTPRWVTTLGDVAEHCYAALQTASQRADVVLVTGGLGPTHDDITKKVVTEFFDSRLVLNPEWLEAIKQRFMHRNIPLAKVNEEQAMVPEDADMIENPLGTAPGMVFRTDKVTCYVMPGVPHEMHNMMQSFVLPELKKQTGQVIRMRTLKTTGIPESTLYEKMGDIESIGAKVAFLPGLDGVKIRLTVEAESEQDADRQLQRAAEQVRERAGEFVYTEEEKALEHVIADLLLERGKTLAVAESCTGGLLADKLTSISGSSKYFMQGVIAYSNEAKRNVLGVAETLLKEHGAVSKPVAAAMARGVKNWAGTDFGLSTTGIAGPTGGTKEKPVGLVYIGFSDGVNTVVEEHRFANDRHGNKVRTAQAVLNLFRKQLLDAE